MAVVRTTYLIVHDVAPLDADTSSKLLLSRVLYQGGITVSLPLPRHIARDAASRRDTRQHAFAPQHHPQPAIRVNTCAPTAHSQFYVH
jgi:hypothetical protein